MSIKDKLSRSEYAEYIRDQIASTAKSVWSGEGGVIEGSCLLWRLRSELSNDHDPNFTIFVAVDSETDHLPVDHERENWSEEVLRRKDVEIAEYEALYREYVLAGCRRVFERFNRSPGI